MLKAFPEKYYKLGFFPLTPKKHRFTSALINFVFFSQDVTTVFPFLSLSCLCNPLKIQFSSSSLSKFQPHLPFVKLQFYSSTFCLSLDEV